MSRQLWEPYLPGLEEPSGSTVRVGEIAAVGLATEDGLLDRRAGAAARSELRPSPLRHPAFESSRRSERRRTRWFCTARDARRRCRLPRSIASGSPIDNPAYCSRLRRPV